MHQRKSKLGRMVGAAGLACTLVFAALGFASLPAGAQTAPMATCPVLSLGNPNPGDLLTPGGYVISGTAYDPAASQGSGIARVDLFLGERDTGGTFLGSAVPGSAGSNPRGFSTEVQVPNLARGLNFAAYAISAMSSQQTTVTFPVFVGTPPAKSGVATPTPVPTVTMTTTCPPSSTGAAAAAAPPTAPMASVPSAPQTASLTGAAACPVLSLGNPNPGDLLTPGGYVISGVAYDPTAPQASGIARVDLFLGERDTGGTFLGSAVPGSAGSNPRAFTVEVQVPNLNRGLDFAVYAISAITGQQTAITFPVFVGVPPTRTTSATPTPIPTTMTLTTTCR